MVLRLSFVSSVNELRILSSNALYDAIPSFLLKNNGGVPANKNNVFSKFLNAQSSKIFLI